MRHKEGTILKRLGLAGWIFVGILLGVLAGWLIGEPILVIARPLGTVFLTLLKMVIVPLVFCSIVTAVANLGGTGSLGRMGLKTTIYVISTSLIAILTGLAIVNLIRPGVGAELGLEAMPESLPGSELGFMEILLRMIPENPVTAAVQGDMVGLIFFAIIFGIFITRVDQQYARPVRELLNGVSEIMMKMTRFVIRLAPFGVFGLVSSIIARTGFAPFVPLGLYALCVVLALLIQGAVTLPLIVWLVGRVNPYRLFKAMAPALMTAFSTASSSATLPLSMECVEHRAGIANRTTSFVMPLGATVNMNGTALYECIAVIFIAQYYSSHGQGFALSIAQQTVVVFTALLAAIGSAGIPMAGVVMMTIVLRSVGLPLEGVGLILAVDRVLDMGRTTINVWGDACGAAVIGASEGDIDLRVYNGEEVKAGSLRGISAGGSGGPRA